MGAIVKGTLTHASWTTSVTKAFLSSLEFCDDSQSSFRFLFILVVRTSF